MCNLSDYIEEAGIQKGIQKGVYSTLFSLVKKERLTVDEAAQEAGVSAEEFTNLYQKHLQEAFE